MCDHKKKSNKYHDLYFNKIISSSEISYQQAFQMYNLFLNIYFIFYFLVDSLKLFIFFIHFL